MKKTVILILLLIISLPVFAFQWGLGYNNTGLTARFWWNDSFGSEISVYHYNWYMYDTTHQTYIESRTFYTIMPVNVSLFKNDSLRISSGVKFQSELNGRDWNDGRFVLTQNEYWIVLTTPEIEFNVPYIENMTCILSLGISFNWKYKTNGDFEHLGVSFVYPLPLATNIGLVYYF